MPACVQDNIDVDLLEQLVAPWASLIDQAAATAPPLVVSVTSGAHALAVRGPAGLPTSCSSSIAQHLQVPCSIQVPCSTAEALE